MKENVKYSVIIPAYNAEKKISLMLDSIIQNRKKFKDFNVVVINDGSTDKTYEICEEYSKKYNYIDVINQKNAGVNNARKRGFISTKSEYVLFFDADDFIEENCFEYIECEVNSGNYDVIEFGFKKIDPLTMENESVQLLENVINKDILKYFLSSKNSRNYLWNKVFKRTVINYDDFFQFSYGEDFLLLVKVFARIKKMKVSNKVIYNYLLYNDSACAIKYSTKHLDILKVNDCVYEFLKLNHKELLGYSSIIACSNLAKLYTCAKATPNCSSNEVKKIYDDFNRYFKILKKEYKIISYKNISKNKILSIIIFYISPTIYYIFFKDLLLKNRR